MLEGPLPSVPHFFDSWDSGSWCRRRLGPKSATYWSPSRSGPGLEKLKGSYFFWESQESLHKNTPKSRQGPGLLFATKQIFSVSVLALPLAGSDRFFLPVRLFKAFKKVMLELEAEASSDKSKLQEFGTLELGYTRYTNQPANTDQPPLLFAFTSIEVCPRSTKWWVFLQCATGQSQEAPVKKGEVFVCNASDSGTERLEQCDQITRSTRQPQVAARGLAKSWSCCLLEMVVPRCMGFYIEDLV